MSQVSPSTARRPARFAVRFALSMALVAAVIAAAMGPAGPGLMRVASQARLHAPDMALWAGLSLPIRIHVLAALAALALGGVLMTRRKGRTFHRVAGWTWVALVAVTAGVTLAITELTPGRWSLLHLFTGWVFIALPVAVIAARRHAVARHRRFMMGLFYGGFVINLFIAFIPGRAMWTMFFG